VNGHELIEALQALPGRFLNEEVVFFHEDVPRISPVKDVTVVFEAQGAVLCSKEAQYVELNERGEG